MMIRVWALLSLLVLSAPAAYAQAPRFDVSGGYALARETPESLHGFVASVTGHVRETFGITGEVGGNYLTIDEAETDVLSFLVGPRWTNRELRRASPYVQVLVGGVRASQEFEGETTTDTEFAIQPGGGVDVWLSPNFGIRGGGDWRRIAYADGRNQFRVHIGVVVAGGRR
jgi:hypothetical protein